MKITKKLLASALLATTTMFMLQPMDSNIEAATKLKLSSTKLTMTIGTSKCVSASQKVSWKTSNKKIATVKKLTGKKAKIKAKKAGTCKIIVTAGNKNAVIRVKVKAQENKTTPTPNVTTAVSPTATPFVTPQPSTVATQVPVATTETPVLTTELPLATTEQPVAATNVPQLITELPTATKTPANDIPHSTTQAAIQTATPNVVTNACVTMSSVIATSNAEGMTQLSFVVNNNTNSDISYNFASLELLNADGSWTINNGYYPTQGLLPASEQESQSVELGKLEGTIRYTLKVIEKNTGKEALIAFVTTIKKEQGVVLQKLMADDNQLTYRITNNYAQTISYQYNSYSIYDEDGNWSFANLYVPDSGSLEAGDSKEVTVSVLTNKRFRYGIKVEKADGQIEYVYLIVEK